MRTSDGSKECPACHKSVNPANTHCFYCGYNYPVDPDAPPPEPPAPPPIKAIQEDAPETMRELLARHENRVIGINFNDPTKVKRARLVNVREDYFSVADGSLLLHFPYRWILSVSEAVSGGVSVGTWAREDYNLVVFLYHHVIYKGSIGFEIPLG